MPFDKKTYRVLSGSLNLLPPGGEIPEDGARNNLNCRVDQQGAPRPPLPVPAAS